MRAFLAAIVLLIPATFVRIAVAAENLRIGVQNERPPFSFSDADGKLQGFDVEIAWALCATLKVQCDLSPLEFAALIPGLQEGRIDAAVASMSITDERLQLVDFTDKYYKSGNRFVARRGAFASFSLADLAGKTIGVKRATTHDYYLSNTVKDESSIRRYGNSDEIYIDLVLGRLDLALGDAISLTESFLKTDLGRDFDFVGPELGDPKWFGRGEGIAVRKGNAELLTRLNLALRQILADGTYTEIRSQYFDYDIYDTGASVADSHAGGDERPSSNSQSPIGR
jgi:arginine/ornithine transport system substrate-binding protein